MTFSLSIHNTFSALAEAQERMEAFLSGHGVSFEASYAVRLSIEELVSNIIRHGYDDRLPHEIGIYLEIQPTSIELTMDEAPTGGMGLSLVRTMAGPIEYQRQDSRNRARLRIATSQTL